MSEKKDKLILLTGGHAGSTALATIEELHARGFTNIHWAGPKYSKEGSTAQTFEFNVFPKKNVVCHPVRAGRLQRKLTRYFLLSLLKLPLGFWDAGRLVFKLKPHLILSYGGFAAFPLVLASYIKRVPIIIHEQTIAAGLANRLSAPFADKIAISRDESRQFFPEKKIVFTGNPIRKNIRQVLPKKKLSKRPTIYITGGSRGSTWINDAVKPIIPTLLVKYKLIHQCSDVDIKDFQKLKKSLGVNKNYYEVNTFYSENQIQDVYTRADMLIGRAGANTVSEVVYLNLPSILIPIPWVQQNEQYKNAKIANEIGICKIINQKDLSSDLLLSTIYQVEKEWQSMVKRAGQYKNLDANAHEKLVKLVMEVI